MEAESSEGMFEKEKELVEIGPHSYNLKEGGEGGWDHINDSSDTHLERVRRAGAARWKSVSHEERCLHMSKIGNHSDTHLAKMREQSLSKEACCKREITYRKIKHAQGEKNSQYGTMWITNKQENRKIKKTDLILEGWRKGRITKNNGE